MKTVDCPRVLHDTIARFSKEFEVSIDSPELRLHGCAACIESTLSTWISMWEDGSLTREDLLMFLDFNFRACLQAWSVASSQLSEIIGTEHAAKVSKLHSFVLRIESQHAAAELFDQSVICALISSMVARQAFDRGALPATSFDKEFLTSSPSIHPDFFQQCLLRANLQLLPKMSLREMTTLMFQIQDDRVYRNS